LGAEKNRCRQMDACWILEAGCGAGGYMEGPVEGPGWGAGVVGVGDVAAGAVPAGDVGLGVAGDSFAGGVPWDFEGALVECGMP
jgi:hypothetical protein